MGLHMAGFEVTGIDLEPQPRYPFMFIQGDATKPPVRLAAFDFIWASPPCQAHSSLRHLHPERSYACHIDQTREILKRSGVPYCIENVPGAPLDMTFKLCGSAFGLRVRRHRHFESSFFVLEPQCRHDLQGPPLDISGTGGRRINFRPDNKGGNANKPRNLAEAQAAIGIDWMRRAELAEAIPPAYSRFIAAQFSGD